MCLIAVAWRVHPHWELVIAANRDEARDRPSIPLHAWGDRPIVAGRDGRAGGTWLAVHRDGRVSAVTNQREPAVPAGPKSRGDLPLAAFDCGIDAASAHGYSGFHLLLAESRVLWHHSNREPGPVSLAPGIHAVSNGPLADRWPKTERARLALSAALVVPDLAPASLFPLLADRTSAPDERLPSTGVGIELERALAPAFVDLPGYGTRCSTVVLRSADEVWVVERSFDDGEDREVRWDR